jgi:MATE family multidrug resistance protein
MVSRSRILSEVRATVALAAPLAAANVAQLLMGFIATVMVGRLGAVPLAATGLGAALYFTTCIILQGVLGAVSPLAAHAIGRGDAERASHIVGDGLVLAALLALPVVTLALTLDRVLVRFGYDPALAAEIGRYLHAIAWGAPGFLAFGVLRSYLTVLSRTPVVMIVLLSCVGLHAALNWVLIYGNLGAPALGVAGAGYTGAIVHWLMCLGLAAYIAGARGLVRLRSFRAALRPPWPEIRQILRLGTPIGGIYAIEMTVFLSTGLVIGMLGAAPLGAHHIMLNFSSLTFMVPLGIGSAATVRVAVELGAGRPADARRAGCVALALGAAFMSLTAVGIWLFRESVIAVYVDIHDPANRELVATALQLFVIAAIFQVFDGLQTIAAGVLRGYKDTTVPMILAALGYWMIGFAGGWVLAFPVGLGAVGLWSGMALGIAVVAALMSGRFLLLDRVRAVAAPAPAPAQ